VQIKLNEFVAGKYTAELQYWVFLSNKINEKWVWKDSEINIL
jgi:hypothetical protein